MLDRNTIIRITNLMKQADRIEIYGVGINYNLANMIAYRFETVNKDCFVYTSAHWEHLKYLETSKLRTIAILISRTGKNPIILDAAKRLKESHVKTISISGNSSDLLKKETDQNIQILDYENELELKTTMFYIGAQYVMDVCISSIQIYDIKKIEMISKKMEGEREKWMK
ncbi:MAG: SIS domain-containing protein [Erysipelotrichaceae bacterium]|nr:SIS domain-containing protein [Erysipelotrichaceae bacterium]